VPQALITAARNRPDRPLDAAGQRSTLDDTWGHSTNGYDPAGRLTSASYNSVPGASTWVAARTGNAVATGHVALTAWCSPQMVQVTPMEVGGRVTTRIVRPALYVPP